METKKNVVSKILHNTRTFTTQNGQMFVHQITFENGDQGEYNSKSETCSKFHEGQEASYTIETKVNGKYTNVLIKPATEFIPNATGFKAKSGSDQSFALSYAKDFACSQIEAGAVNMTAEKVIEVAEKFHGWLKSKQA